MHRSATWLLAVAIAATTAPGPASAQEKGDIRELKLRDWEPRSMLVTKATEVARPAFPVIDVHNHLGGGKAFLTPERVKHYLDGDGRGRRARRSSTSTAAGASGSRRPSPPSTRPTPAGSSPTP